MAAELDWDRWPGFAPHVKEALEGHLWPGNVRELRNVVERAVYRWANDAMPIGHVQFDPFDSPWRPRPPEHRRTPGDASASAPASGHAVPASASVNFDAIEDLRAAVDAHEKTILAHALGKHRWNQRQTARALGLTYDQLRHCIRKHGLMEGQDED
jgi:psp operon transcriptional activator